MANCRRDARVAPPADFAAVTAASRDNTLSTQAMFAFCRPILRTAETLHVVYEEPACSREEKNASGTRYESVFPAREFCAARQGGKEPGQYKQHSAQDR
jgi:hypothetical protein